MSTKFFNNDSGNTLFAKLSAIASPQGMADKFRLFRAVTGYFRSSGYFKLRQELASVEKIQVLVGIDLDDIFRGMENAGKLFYCADAQTAKAAELSATLQNLFNTYVSDQTPPPSPDPDTEPVVIISETFV